MRSLTYNERESMKGSCEYQSSPAAVSEVSKLVQKRRD